MKTRLIGVAFCSSLVAALGASCIDLEDPSSRSDEWSYASQTNGQDAGPDGGQDAGDAGTAEPKCRGVGVATNLDRSLDSGKFGGKSGATYHFIAVKGDKMGFSKIYHVYHPNNANEDPVWRLQHLQYRENDGASISSVDAFLADGTLWKAFQVRITEEAGVVKWTHSQGKEKNPPVEEDLCLYVKNFE